LLKVEKGRLVCTGEKARLRTKKSTATSTPTGLPCRPAATAAYVRVPKDGNHHREKISSRRRVRVQVLDDADPMYKTLKDFQFSASIYDFTGANPQLHRPWNTLEINAAAAK
jgi:hypothetical protein